MPSKRSRQVWGYLAVPALLLAIGVLIVLHDDDLIDFGRAPALVVTVEGGSERTRKALCRATDSHWSRNAYYRNATPGFHSVVFSDPPAWGPNVKYTTMKVRIQSCEPITAEYEGIPGPLPTGASVTVEVVVSNPTFTETFTVTMTHSPPDRIPKTAGPWEAPYWLAPESDARVVRDIMSVAEGLAWADTFTVDELRNHLADKASDARLISILALCFSGDPLGLETLHNEGETLEAGFDLIDIVDRIMLRREHGIAEPGHSP